MPSSIFFRGQNLYDPATVVDINNVLLSPDNLGAKNLCVVGEFPHLEPQKVHVFKSTGGPGVSEIYPNQLNMKLLDEMWKNSIKDSRQVSTSLSYVNACDPTSNLQASSNLRTRADDAATGAVDEEYYGAQANAIALKSVIWGDNGNLNRLDVAIDRTAADLDEIFTLTYTELGQLPAVQVIGSGGVISFTSTIAGTLVLNRAKTGRNVIWTPDGGSAVTVAIDEMTSMQQLKDRLDLETGLSCEVLSFEFEPKQLDAFDLEWQVGAVAQTRENLHRKLYTATATAIQGAHVQKIVDHINTLTSIKLTAEVTLFDANLVQEAVTTTGGANGASPDAADYQAALAAIVDKDLQLITCLLEDNDALRRSVAGHMKTHIESCLDSSRDRQAYMPCDEETSIDNAHDLYARPNTNVHIAYVIQGLTFDNQPINKIETLGNEYMAFLLMCMQGAIPYAEPISRKNPNIINTIESYDRDDRKNVNRAIRKNLVIVSMGLNNTLKVNRGVTSWFKDNEEINCEMSSRESILGCARFMRMELDREVGGKILVSTKNALQAIATVRLKELVTIGMIKAFGAVKVSIVGDTALVEFDIAPVHPLNFIRITLNVVRQEP